MLINTFTILTYFIVGCVSIRNDHCFQFVRDIQSVRKPASDLSLVKKYYLNTDNIKNTIFFNSTIDRVILNDLKLSERFHFSIVGATRMKGDSCAGNCTAEFIKQHTPNNTIYRLSFSYVLKNQYPCYLIGECIIEPDVFEQFIYLNCCWFANKINRTVGKPNTIGLYATKQLKSTFFSEPPLFCNFTFEMILFAAVTRISILPFVIIVAIYVLFFVLLVYIWTYCGNVNEHGI